MSSGGVERPWCSWARDEDTAVSAFAAAAGGAFLLEENVVVVVFVFGRQVERG